LDVEGLDEEDILDAIRKEVLETCPRKDGYPTEEWGVLDYEVLPNMGQYPDLQDLVAISRATEEHGESLVQGLYDRNICKPSGLADYISENYSGLHDSLGDYAVEVLEGQVNLPESLAPYFDYDKYGEDLRIEGDIFTISEGSQVHVFWAR
jgi:antirestriction protein